MKKILLLMIGTLALTACTVRMFNGGGKIIEASDNIVTTEYELDAFEEVDMHVVGNVVLIQSDSINGMVELTAPDNYIELYKFDSKNGKLGIGFTKDNINIHTKDVKITVYTTKLNTVHNSGTASMSMDSLNTDRLEVKNSGVGSFMLNKVVANDVTVRCSGVGDVAISGQCDNADLSCSGTGHIRAKDLKSQNTKARVSGVGSISCHATEYLDGKVTGVGLLEYAGNPKKIDKNNPTTGKIKAL